MSKKRKSSKFPSKQGGSREGAGRKPSLYGEPTEQIYISVPTSKKPELIDYIKSKLATWKLIK